MPVSVQQRVKQIRDEVQSRLDLTDDQMKALASHAAMKISHASGDWEAGRHVPSQGKEAWIIVAAFDHSPAEYDHGEQGEEWTYGESRVYVLCPADVFGPLRDQIVAPGSEMVCMLYRLFQNGLLIAKPKSEPAFVDCLCDEFEVLKNMAGIGDEDDEEETWECPGCGAENDDDMGDGDDETEATKVSFCAKCGAARVEVVPQ
ncbi:MAG TPA: hypothetical protein VNV25_25535 [Gemmatimonadaceae bacterium]|jgi:hypothetical protein|nr:hypothetical protein [Gemmatimonadaceae bacterium]